MRRRTGGFHCAPRPFSQPAMRVAKKKGLGEGGVPRALSTMATAHPRSQCACSKSCLVTLVTRSRLTLAQWTRPPFPYFWVEQAASTTVRRPRPRLYTRAGNPHLGAANHPTSRRRAAHRAGCAREAWGLWRPGRPRTVQAQSRAAAPGLCEGNICKPQTPNAVRASGAPAAARQARQGRRAGPAVP